MRVEIDSFVFDHLVIDYHVFFLSSVERNSDDIDDL